MTSPPRACYLKTRATFMLTGKRCVAVHTGEVECCKHGNKYLICFVCAEKTHCVYKMFVHWKVPARQYEWFTVQHAFSVIFKGNAADCYWTTIINNHQSHVCLACLLSFRSGKWQINILFLDRYLLCEKGKASQAHFIHTQYTLWVTVCIKWLNKSCFFTGGGKSGVNHHLFILFILTTQVRLLYKRGMHNSSTFMYI